MNIGERETVHDATVRSNRKKKHAITQEQVRQSLLFRRTSLDIAVIVSFACSMRLWPVSFVGRIWEACPPVKAGLPERRWVLLASAWSAFLSRNGRIMGTHK